MTYEQLALPLTLALLVPFFVVERATPWVVRLALRVGCVDAPGGRRVHANVTPRLGGLGIAAGALAGMIAVSWVPGIAAIGYGPLVAALVASAGILALGLVDDLRHVDPPAKLVVQTALALICWLGGVRVEQANLIGVGVVAFHPAVGLALTVAWIVGVTNAINLLDGLDGLASGVVAIVASTMCMIGFTMGAPNPLLMLACAALASSCMGFLLHNGHPAKIFMGDTGSLFLGFVIANLSLLTSHKTATATALGIPIVALGVPIADTVIAFSRRVLRGQSPFVADRDHLHHVLARVGMRARTAVLVIHIGTGVLCAFALASSVDPRALFFGVGTLVCGLAWLFVLVRRGDRLAARVPDEEDDDAGAALPAAERLGAEQR